MTAKKKVTKKPVKKTTKPKKVVKKVEKKEEPAKVIVVAPVVDATGVVTISPVPPDYK